MKLHLRGFVLIGLLAGCAVRGAAPEPRLAETYTVQWLQENLATPADFRPFPTAADRAGWEAVEPKLREALIASAAKELEQPWVALTASRYLDYVRDGNRSRFQVLNFERRQRGREFAIAECLEGRGRFIDEAMNGVWLLCDEATWVLPAHLFDQRAGLGLPDGAEPTIDLFAAETGAQLAWVGFLLGPQFDNISPLIRARIRTEIDRRILTPFLARDSYFWMGFRSKEKLNNWTPWIVSNVLACALLAEPDGLRRAQVVHRCLQIMDNYLATQAPDGGCEEGPGYWGRSAGSAFDALELLYLATNGKLNGFTSPKMSAMAAYIYRANIAGRWFVNFADASPQPGMPGALCYRYGERIGDRPFMAFGAWFEQQDTRIGRELMDSLTRTIPAILRSAEIQRVPAVLPLPQDTWLPDLQLMTARTESGSARGLFLAAKGGNNGTSHNHNDVGSCLVFADGRPVLIDPGVDSYTRKTFSADRFTIWTMQSAYHNLPTINGVMQSHGAEFAARNVVYQNDARSASFSLDLAGAYPPAAKVARWQRQYVLTRPDRCTITDDFVLDEVTAPAQWHFMVPAEPVAGQLGEWILYPESAQPVTLRFDPACKVRVEAVELEGRGLQGIWGRQIFRMTVEQPTQGTQGSFKLEITLELK